MYLEEKWAVILGFSEEWTTAICEFIPKAKKIPFDPENNELKKLDDPMQNLVSYLGYCEDAENRYAVEGIPHDILLATLADIKIWAYRYKEVYGGFGLKEIGWTRLAIDLKLFTIGRLQYRAAKFLAFSLKRGLFPGSPIMEIHIPRGAPLSIDTSLESIERAKAFYAKFFPNYKYRYFTCTSWLLDKGHAEYLAADSNIRGFASLFDLVLSVPSNDCIRFIFGETYNKKNIASYEPKTYLQQKIREKLLSGASCKVGYGVRPVCPK